MKGRQTRNGSPLRQGDSQLKVQQKAPPLIDLQMASRGSRGKLCATNGYSQGLVDRRSRPLRSLRVTSILALSKATTRHRQWPRPEKPRRGSPDQSLIVNGPEQRLTSCATKWAVIRFRRSCTLRIGHWPLASFVYLSRPCTNNNSPLG